MAGGAAANAATAALVAPLLELLLQLLSVRSAAAEAVAAAAAAVAEPECWPRQWLQRLQEVGSNVLHAHGAVQAAGGLGKEAKPRSEVRAISTLLPIVPGL